MLQCVFYYINYEIIFKYNLYYSSLLVPYFCITFSNLWYIVMEQIQDALLYFSTATRPFMYQIVIKKIVRCWFHSKKAPQMSHNKRSSKGGKIKWETLYVIYIFINSKFTALICTHGRILKIGVTHFLYTFNDK